MSAEAGAPRPDGADDEAPTDGETPQAPTTNAPAEAETAAPDVSDIAAGPGRSPRRRRLSAFAPRVPSWRAVRPHTLFLVVFAGGLALRVMVQLAYRPAILYLDSFGYLGNLYTLDPTGGQPIGYPLFMRPLIAVGGIALVAVVQHLLGLLMGVGVYALLLRWGARRWLAALAAAPVLLDSYQVEIEHNIMSDTLFEAMILAVVLVLAWRRPGPLAAAVGGLLLGAAVAVRVVGEFVIVPVALVVLVAAVGRWRRVATVLALVAAFAAPVGAYAAYFHSHTGMWGVSNTGDRALYGRVAVFADCSRLQLPEVDRQLCPIEPLDQRPAIGVDYYSSTITSPVFHVVAPPGTTQHQIIRDFCYRVIEQQFGDFVTAVARDSGKLFMPVRASYLGDVTLDRWRFQPGYPLFPDTDPTWALSLFGEGPPQADPGLTGVLRAYQNNGGYTPGPLLAVCVLLGLAGAVRGRRRAPVPAPDDADVPEGRADDAVAARRALRNTGLRCATLLTLLTGGSLLLVADAYEFSWRYQMPAMVFLPLAGALGLTALLQRRQPKRRRPRLEPFPDPVDAAAVAAFDARHPDHRFAECTIVIAAYNEAEAIGGVLESMPRSCRGLDIDVLVVVDGARDDTAAVVARHPDVLLCDVPVNRGQGAALRLGYHLAHRGGARLVVTTDADGQYDIDELPTLLDPLLDGRADFVTGSRILGRHETDDHVRRLGSHVFGWLVTLLTRQRVTDTSFGLRGMRAAVPVSVRLTQPQYQSSELLIGIMAAGFRVTEVPMTMHTRSGGTTKKGNNLLYGCRYARVVLGTWWRERRSAAWSSAPPPTGHHALDTSDLTSRQAESRL